MLEILKQYDTDLFLWLNGMHTPFWDSVMAAITSKFTWFPFYGILIFLLIRRYRWQAGWLILLLVAVITLADKTASAIMKPYFARLRPCYEPTIQKLVHVVGGCGGEYGFVSSHSANTFGLAMALWLLFRNESRRLHLLFGWALLVTYSRIYVGVHYPLDLLGGALVGVFYAWLLVTLYRVCRQSYEARHSL